jgi:hypothetical protein
MSRLSFCLMGLIVTSILLLVRVVYLKGSRAEGQKGGSFRVSVPLRDLGWQTGGVFQDWVFTERRTPSVLTSGGGTWRRRVSRRNTRMDKLNAIIGSSRLTPTESQHRIAALGFLGTFDVCWCVQIWCPENRYGRFCLTRGGGLFDICSHASPMA